MGIARVSAGAVLGNKRRELEQYILRQGHVWQRDPRMPVPWSAFECVTLYWAYLDGLDDPEGWIPSLEDIELHATWTGKPGLLVEALIATRWIEKHGKSWKWHDYESWNGRAITARRNGQSGGRPREPGSRRSVNGVYAPPGHPSPEPNRNPTETQTGTQTGTETGTQAETKAGTQTETQPKPKPKQSGSGSGSEGLGLGLADPPSPPEAGGAPSRPEPAARPAPVPPGDPDDAPPDDAPPAAAPSSDPPDDGPPRRGRRAPSAALPPLADAWNVAVAGTHLARVTRVAGSRARALAARMREEPDLAVWQRAFALIASDPFCLGQSHGGWTAGFDYAISTKSARWLDAARQPARPAPPPQPTNGRTSPSHAVRALQALGAGPDPQETR